jgi:putative ABC transport system permease protein
VAPVSSKSIQAVFGNQNWSTQVTGSDNEYFRVTNRSIGKGRPFSDSELRNGAAVCIVGETVRKKLFGGQESLGGNIRLEKLSCQVIGILEPKGQNTMGMDQDDIVVIPLRTYQRRISGNQDVAMFQVSVQQGASTDKAQRDIRLLMRERRHLSRSDDDNFNVMDMKEIANMLAGTTQRLRLCWCRGGRQPPRQWHRHHEHHVGVGHERTRGSVSAPIGAQASAIQFLMKRGAVFLRRQ